MFAEERHLSSVWVTIARKKGFPCSAGTIEQVLLINLCMLVILISVLEFSSLKYGTLLLRAQSSSNSVTEKVTLKYVQAP